MNETRYLANDDSGWMNTTLFLMPNWKWIGIVIAIAAGFLLKSLLKKLFFRLKTSPLIRGKQQGFLMYFMNTDLQTPIAWILTSLFWIASVDGLSLPPRIDKYLTLAAQVILSLNAIILAYRATEAGGRLLLDYASKTESNLDNQLAPMATRIAKFLVIAFGILITLQNLGLNVMSVLAGLGLGGLALALAAQDTAANFFGSVTIMADRPFQVGDWIKIGDTEGIVEDVGIRSTRIRTFYNSLVVVPNSIIAKEKLENVGVRPMARILHRIGVTYETPIEKIKSYMEALENFLKSNPDIASDITVKFVNMGDFSLQILVVFYVKSASVPREREIQQDFLFYAMQTAADMKIDFAYPTATHILKSADPT